MGAVPVAAARGDPGIRRSGPTLNVLPPGAPRPGRPSQDGLRLILAGTAYLMAICLLQIGVGVSSALGGAGSAPSRWTDVRDVVALFGWVGLMISGVGVIIVPNHFRVALRPAILPRFHLVLANVGLIGLVGAQALGNATAALGFLGVLSVSYLAFALGIVRTIAPFLRGASETDPSRPPTADATGGRPPRPR